MENVAPIARTLLLKLFHSYMPNSEVSVSTLGNLPSDLRGVCLLYGRRFRSNHLSYLPRDLRVLCMHIYESVYRYFFTTSFFSNIEEYFPKLEILTMVNDNGHSWGKKGTHSMDGLSLLRYLQGATHLKELRLFTGRFHDIELNDFYDRALEIIENREVKLPLKIYHRGETLVRNNNSLKIFNSGRAALAFCKLKWLNRGEKSKV